MYSVIIPSRNETNLRACVSAIRTAGETCRIIHVDDGVSLGIAPPPEWFLWEIANQSFVSVEGRKPFCFSANINIGIRAAGEDDCLLCNDDALLKTPHGFSSLSEMANLHVKYGVISAVTNSIGNPNQVGITRKSNAWTAVREEPRTLAFVCVYVPWTTINTV